MAKRSAREEEARVKREMMIDGSDKPLDYSEWSAEDRRKIIRELIAHEDKLTTERTQTLYTLQGFLFAAMGIVVGKGFPLALELKLLLTIIAVTGMLSAALYLQEFLYNTKATLNLLDDWKRIQRDCREKDPPKVIGYESRKQNRPGGARWLTRKVIPINFIIVWGFVIGVAWVSEKLR